MGGGVDGWWVGGGGVGSNLQRQVCVCVCVEGGCWGVGWGVEGLDLTSRDRCVCVCVCVWREGAGEWGGGWGVADQT